LGNFNLEGIPPAPRGVPRIEVTFDIDANGILSVSATDKGTGKEQKITITNSSGLSDAEIERMVREAEENAAADKAKREGIDIRNEADSLTYSTEKTLKDLGDKVDGAEKQKVEDAIAALKQALQGDNTDEIKAKTEELKQASYKIAELLYKQQGPSPEQPTQNTESTEQSDSDKKFDKGTADDVEYEVKDD
jgi:molecular chaperone DnaK